MRIIPHFAQRLVYSCALKPLLGGSNDKFSSEPIRWQRVNSSHRTSSHLEFSSRRRLEKGRLRFGNGMNQQYVHMNYGGAPYGNFIRHQIPLRGNPRRTLMKELVTKKPSGTESVGYFMSVIQSPLLENRAPESRMGYRYDGLEHGAPDLAPWVILQSRFARNEEVTFPISMCANLYSQLLSCGQMNKDDLDSSGESRTTPNLDQIDEGDCVFDLSTLEPAEVFDEAVNWSVKILKENPAADGQSTGAKLDQVKVGRWIQSGPLRETGETKCYSYPLRRNAKTCLEIYESLLPNLITFLSDICVRYRHLDQLPQINFLYSASGERRFFFDIRNTRYGNRLHITQVTDLSRNVIGIPLESLVTFRDRLTGLIDTLKLESGRDMREMLEKCSSHPVRCRSLRQTPVYRPVTANGYRQSRFEKGKTPPQQSKKVENGVEGTVTSAKSIGTPRQLKLTPRTQLQPTQLSNKSGHENGEVEGKTDVNGTGKKEIERSAGQGRARRRARRKRFAKLMEP